jgi:hypothetical protein
MRSRLLVVLALIALTAPVGGRAQGPPPGID